MHITDISQFKRYLHQNIFSCIMDLVFKSIFIFLRLTLAMYLMMTLLASVFPAPDSPANNSFKIEQNCGRMLT